MQKPCTIESNSKEAEKTEPCIYEEKWVATSWNFKNICAFLRFFNVTIPNWPVLADIFSKQIVFFDPGDTRIVEKIQLGKMKKKLLY